MKNKMISCKHCGQEIAAGAKTCPACGGKNKRPLFKKWWFWVIIVIAVIAIANSGSDSGSSTGDTVVNDAGLQTESSDNNEAENTVPEENDNVPTEYKSALKKAKRYSDAMHMSKAGIYDQLTSEYGEQFTEEAAQYAMDNLEADYNANALKKAEEYSKTMHMSKAGIYDQLISEYGEQFTPEEAQYAVDNLKADYNANALAKAKSYQNTMDMSPTAIYDQLISEYGEKFTPEEAQYAIDNLE